MNPQKPKQLTTWRCIPCGRHFIAKNEWVEHISDVHIPNFQRTEDKIYACNTMYCGQLFQCHWDLLMHYEKSHLRIVFSCTECTMESSTIEESLAHVCLEPLCWECGYNGCKGDEYWHNLNK